MPRSAAVHSTKVDTLLNQDAVGAETTSPSVTSATASSTTYVPKTKSALERRRAVHLRCEHRRRKEIQDALDGLQAELPPTLKPRSKNAIVVDAAEYIQQLTLALDRLVQENQQLQGYSNKLPLQQPQ